MSRNSVFVLAAIVVVLTAAALWSQHSATPSSDVDKPFMPTLKEQLDGIDHVTLTKAGNEQIVAAELGPSGWVISNKDDYPADVAKIRDPLVALSEAKILEPKTASAELYSHLGVENIDKADAKGVALTLSGSQKPLKVIFGNSEGQKYRYVRLADSAQSYLIDKNPKLPKSATEWLDAVIVDIDPARIQSITVTHADGETLKVAKSSRSDSSFAVEGVPKGRELLYASVADTMASVLKNLRLEDVAKIGSEQGDPTSVTEWRAFDGLILTAKAHRLGKDDWLTFEARYDPELAAAFPAPPQADNKKSADGDQAGKNTGKTAAGPDAGKADSSDEAAAKPAADPQAEAAKLAERLSGWRYRVSSYQFDQLTRRMENLLKAKT